ncbi:MAG: hypothetical protein D6723_17425 [Acidobacteria bacterium]|nr:MAG: hypothetical protein D6723_17425 [Acidobacteriota bacterium]
MLDYEDTVQNEKPRRWAWITNLELTGENGLDGAHAPSLEVNTPKNGGYGGEPIRSHHFPARQNFYLLMPIAH